MLEKVGVGGSLIPETSSLTVRLRLLMRQKHLNEHEGVSTGRRCWNVGGMLGEVGC
jgi:hypothetical protein